MLSLIQNEIVVRHGWLTTAEFTDIVAVSQITPGPIAINSATYVGYSVAGVWGSIVATVAVSLPSLTIMVLLTRYFLRLRNNRYVSGVVTAMKPVVLGMILAAALLLMFPASAEDASFIDGWSWALFGACMLGSFRKINPIIMILLSAVAGIVIYYIC